MKNWIIGAIGVVIVVAGTVIWRFAINPGTENTQACPVPPANTISYCHGGFNSITIKVGDKNLVPLLSVKSYDRPAKIL